MVMPSTVCPRGCRDWAFREQAIGGQAVGQVDDQGHHILLDPEHDQARTGAMVAPLSAPE